VCDRDAGNLRDDFVFVSARLRRAHGCGVHLAGDVDRSVEVSNFLG